MVVVALLGLGEAGSEMAAGLRAAGATVRGYDARAELTEFPSAAEAVAGAEIVLSVNAASVAVSAAREAAPGLSRGMVYADVNSAGPYLKREVAAVVEPTGASFADVALMAPVFGRGVAIPALASGGGAAAFAAALRPLGMPVEVLGDEPGDAALRKLLRSVFMKGIAAAAIEALAAARAAGCEDWLRAELAEVFESADAALLQRLETGSRRHAARRVHEVEDASELLRSLRVEPRVSEASAGWLRSCGTGVDGGSRFAALRVVRDTLPVLRGVYGLAVRAGLGRAGRPRGVARFARRLRLGNEGRPRPCGSSAGRCPVRPAFTDWQ